MKKVSELTGAELDYWVAKAKYYSAVISDGLCWIIDAPEQWDRYQPSSDWSHGGPIIEREGICLRKHWGRDKWGAQLDPDRSCLAPIYGYGESPLIAAMRAFVSSHFGDEVPNE